MPYAAEEILQAIRTLREAAGLSQRDLSARIGVPQSHISKIEGGGTDLRLSSLIELARALDHEVVLVPRKALPAVEAIVESVSSIGADDARLRASVLKRAQAAVSKLGRLHPNARDLEAITQTLRELGNLRLARTEFDMIRRITDRLAKLPTGPHALTVIQSASKQLRDLRNRGGHTIPQAPRPAYQLDEEDEDA